MTYLRQGFYIQQWQYGGSNAAEQNIDDAIALALQYKAAGIMEKVFDGTVWMSQYAWGSPASVDDVIASKNKCDAAGLVYIPWTNPLYGGWEHLQWQAALYAEVGNIAGFLGWDTEPYAGFWGANRPEGAADFLMAKFRSFAPDCINIWQPDPRPNRLTELRPWEWSSRMHVYAPQTYWGDFETNPRYEIERARDQAINFALEYAPTISTGGATAAEFADAVTIMGEVGAVSTLAWRLGTLDDAFLSVLRDLAGATPNEPEHPTDPCVHMREQLQAWADAVPYTKITRKQLRTLLSEA